MLCVCFVCLVCFILCLVACLAGPGQGSGDTRAVITSTRSTARAAAAASAGALCPERLARALPACLQESRAPFCRHEVARGTCVWVCDLTGYVCGKPIYPFQRCQTKCRA